MKAEFSYRLLIPAISDIEAVILADEKPIPSDGITDIETDVVEVAEVEPM